jgi:alpha-tubulin suppressor-like RCC1 family protein
LALNTVGEIWSWGRYEYTGGQLGNGTTVDNLEPSRMDASNDWSFISAGNWHNAALKTDGTLWVWGGNDHWQLGQGNPDENSLVPIQLGSSNDWRTVAAGAYHTLAIKTDGSLWGWGYNNFQQLTSAAEGPYQQTPLRIGTEKRLGADQRRRLPQRGAEDRRHALALGLQPLCPGTGGSAERRFHASPHAGRQRY